MANGKLAPKIYLNSLWTGAGKSSLVTCFVGALINSPDHRDVGVIVCVPYRHQILELLCLTRLTPQQCAFYINKDATFETKDHAPWLVKRGFLKEGYGERHKFNELSPTAVNEAQVLFTTQQMVNFRLQEGKSFGDLQYMHYKGKARQVKLWDEAITSWEELTLDFFEFTDSPGLLKRYNTPLALKLFGIAQDILKLKEGTYTFPDFEDEYGETWDDILQSLKERGEELDSTKRRVAYCLWKMSGREVRVTTDAEGRAAIDWKQSLPDDFFPVVVFDASGKIRTMNDYYAEATDKLEHITDIKRDFSHLTFHHINLGGGKDSWRKRKGPLLELTRELVNLEPDRKTLVIYHSSERDKGKKLQLPNIQQELEGQSPNTGFLTWGNHKQTNQFMDYNRLILAGLLYLPQPDVQVRTYASRQVPTKLELSRNYFRELERGEIKSDLLQAVGRIARTTESDGKPTPADIYIIASDKQMGSVQTLLQKTFPRSQYRKYKREGEKNEGQPTKVDILAASSGSILLTAPR